MASNLLAAKRIEKLKATEKTATHSDGIYSFSAPKSRDNGRKNISHYNISIL